MEGPGGSEVKASAYNAGDLHSIPGSGRSPGGEYSNPLQYPCLENPMDRGAWWAIVHRVAKFRTSRTTQSEQILQGTRSAATASGRKWRAGILELAKPVGEPQILCVTAAQTAGCPPPNHVNCPSYVLRPLTFYTQDLADQ